MSLFTKIYELLRPNERYAVWRIEAMPSQDSTRIIGQGKVYGDDWEVRLDNLLLPGLPPQVLLQQAIHFAEYGGSPDQFRRKLETKFNHTLHQQALIQQHQQAMQNQLSGWQNPALGPAMGYGQQQAMNQQALGNNYLSGPQMAQLARDLGMDIPDAPLWENPAVQTEEIIAYRSWLLDFEVDDDAPVSPSSLIAVRPVLHSINQICLWPGPTLRSPEPPTANSRVGIYAVGLEDRHLANWKAHVACGMIWGEVALSGIVVEGEQGYRAEVCTIRKLFISSGGEKCPRFNVYVRLPVLVQLLEDRYQCEVGQGLICPSVANARAISHKG